MKWPDLNNAIPATIPIRAGSRNAQTPSASIIPMIISIVFIYLLLKVEQFKVLQGKISLKLFFMNTCA